MDETTTPPDILIVHLSDFHIARADSPACAKLQAVSGAIGSRIARPTHIILLASGDIAYSGLATEYDAAADAFETLIRNLEAWNPLSIRLLASPGNHDCDFSKVSPRVREALLKDLGGSAADVSSAIEILVTTQTEFAVFRDVVCSTTERHGPLVSVANLSYEDLTITISLLNSAWASALNEVPGQLRMPVAAIPSYDINSHLSIGVIHHPLNWYAPEDVRAFSGWLDHNVDIAFWGHEHEKDDIEHRRNNVGSIVRHFIARPIDDSKVECGGASYLISGETKKITQASFVFRPDGSIRLNEAQSEEDIPLNPARKAGKLRFTATHMLFLDDPGGAFQHPRLTRQLRLSEILIAPEFREIENDEATTTTTTSCDDILADIFAGERTIVFGGEQAGKTTLAKNVILEAAKVGVLTLYLDASMLTSLNQGQIKGWINGSFRSQYESDCLDEVLGKPPNQRLVILDNVHHIPGGEEGIEKVLERVQALATRTLLLVGESYSVTMLTTGAGEAKPQYWVGSRMYELLQLGHRKRGELIRKWVSLGRSSVVLPNDLEKEVRQTKDALDSALGKSSIPKYPIFILILLQYAEVGKNIQTAVSGGSQGYLFESLIVRALDLHARSHPINTIHDYLAAFAYRLWVVDRPRMTAVEFEEFHRTFLQESLVAVSKDLITRDLERAQIILIDSSGVSFRYPYLYYYYIARWVVGNQIPESGLLIDTLVNHIHTEKSANILIFIAYLRRQDDILQRLLPKADNLYSEVAVRSLDEHSAVAARFYKVQQRNILFLGKPEHVSDDHNETRDKLEGRGGRSEEIVRDALQINTSLRTIQVLGHVIKSRASAIKPEMKIHIARTVIGLARRLLAVVYGFVDQEAETILWVTTEVLEKALKTDREHAAEAANQFLGMVVSAWAKLSMMRASEALSSPELLPLLQKLNDELEEADDLLIVLLARIAIDVEYPENLVDEYVFRIREGNILTRSVVSHAVAKRFYLAPPERAILDSTCEKLDIDVKKLPPKAPVKHGTGRWG